jgi:hypothetical protein
MSDLMIAVCFVAMVIAPAVVGYMVTPYILAEEEAHG